MKMTNVPDKFRAILKQAETNQVDTKNFVLFCDMFNVYFHVMLPKNIDRYHSLIDLKSQDDYGIHCRDIYILYHNVPQKPPTQFEEIQHQYDEYVRMVVTYNHTITVVQAMEYQNDVKIVEKIITRGNFGKVLIL